MLGMCQVITWCRDVSGHDVRAHIYTPQFPVTLCNHFFGKKLVDQFVVSFLVKVAKLGVLFHFLVKIWGSCKTT